MKTHAWGQLYWSLGNMFELFSKKLISLVIFRIVTLSLVVSLHIICALSVSCAWKG